MKRLLLTTLAMLAFAPATQAETIYSTTRTIDPATGASSTTETVSSVQSAPGYDAEPAYTGIDTTRNLSEEVPSRSLNTISPATRGEINPADIAVNDDTLIERRNGDILYITGGVGHAERMALDAMRAKYNFKLTNTESTGAFVSYTRLSLMDTKGREILSADADPIFFAQLPPGRYTLRAEHEGQTKTQSFQVKPGKPTAVQLSWM